MASAASQGTRTAEGKACKRVLCIRHGESFSNVAKRDLGAWPSAAAALRNLRHASWLATFPMDSSLSPAGEAMVRAQRQVLDADGFYARHGCQKILCSPLRRARQTAVGLFGDPAIDIGQLGPGLDASPGSAGAGAGPQPTDYATQGSSTTTTSSATAHKIEVEDWMYEKALLEHSGVRDMGRRTEALTQRLLHVHPESVIVLVGHSAFFRLLLDVPSGAIDNVAVWSAALLPDGTYTDVRLLHPGGAELLGGAHGS